MTYIFDLCWLLGVLSIAEGLREIYPAVVPLYLGLVLIWVGIAGAKKRTAKK